ncbi:unnamed protein product [Malus baccata var. baccata]
MRIVKTPLRNKMGDQWLSDSMLVYIERDVFAFIDNEPIVRRFHDMKSRWQQLADFRDCVGGDSTLHLMRDCAFARCVWLASPIGHPPRLATEFTILEWSSSCSPHLTLHSCFPSTSACIPPFGCHPLVSPTSIFF